MFGLSFSEIIIIAVLALILLGPDKLPDAAKQAGKLMRQFKAATDDLKDQIETELYSEPKPRPALVPPVPAMPVPGPAGPPLQASAENVPGLEAALAEPPEASAPAAAAPAPAAPATPPASPTLPNP